MYSSGENGLRLLAWVVAGAWVMKLLAAAIGVPRVPDLLRAEFDGVPEGAPFLTVVVPARDEAADVGDGLRSLVAQDYAWLRVIAVDDRSADATGAIMDELAGERLQVMHVRELPAGWLGKTHAMARAAELAGAATDWLLFTDADVVFRADALRRALVYAESVRADHLVVLPTSVIRSWDEEALMGFFQVLGLWGAPLWRIGKRRSKHALGIGAFNLVRRSAYEQVGGFTALRMEIVEDLGLGKRIKNAGLRQRVAFGRGLVSLHWASGARGIVGVLTKNVFAAFRFNPVLVFGFCGWLMVFCVLPFAGVFWRGTLVPGLVVVGANLLAYRLLRGQSGFRVRWALVAPVAALGFCYAIAKSMAVTLRQGGVRWRGTFYSLGELRRNVPPL